MAVDIFYYFHLYIYICSIYSYLEPHTVLFISFIHYLFIYLFLLQCIHNTSGCFPLYYLGYYAQTRSVETPQSRNKSKQIPRKDLYRQKTQFERSRTFMRSTSINFLSFPKRLKEALDEEETGLFSCWVKMSQVASIRGPDLSSEEEK